MRTLPDAQLLVVRSAGHAMMYQYPHALASAINGFIARPHARQAAQAAKAAKAAKAAPRCMMRIDARAGVRSKAVFLAKARYAATDAEVAMTNETCPVRRLQLLLREPCRTDAARKAARRAAEQLGMQISGEGHASLSARMPDDAFRQLFSCSSGTSGTLAVPGSLEPYVSSISEAPQHLSFD